MKTLLFLVLLSFSLFAVIPAAGAQETNAYNSGEPAGSSEAAAIADAANISAMAARGKYLTVKIAVSGPGDELYLWWGHIGLIIEDGLSGKKLFYDWGVFDFEKENFYRNFAFGRLLYSCSVSPEDYANIHNIETNRDLTLYTLDLPPEVKTELLLFAENNVLPENRDYLYHHFRDNCATRVRDIIDRAVGGTFKARYGEAPGRLTLRQHVRRHSWFSPFWDWAFSFLMGRDIDKPTTVWEEMFLPSEIALRCKDFTYTDSSGRERQLVSEVEVLNRAVGRPGTAEIPPPSYREPILGFLLAITLGFLRWKSGTRGGKNPLRERHILGAAQAVLGLFFGVMGLILFFMCFFTTHDYTFHNSNVLFVNPLLLAAVPLGLIAAFGKNPKKHQTSVVLLKALWTIVFLAGFFTVVLRFFPGFYQHNQPTQILVLPFAFVLSLIPDVLRTIKGRHQRHTAHDRHLTGQ